RPDVDDQRGRGLERGAAGGAEGGPRQALIPSRCPPAPPVEPALSPERVWPSGAWHAGRRSLFTRSSNLEQSMPIAVGAVAPDFTLKDENHQRVTLSDFRGKKNVLLVFYPFAFSGVCHGELCEIRDNLADFVNDDAELLAISVDAPYAHKAWALQE